MILMKSVELMSAKRLAPVVAELLEPPVMLLTAMIHLSFLYATRFSNSR
ncbi:MAG: hypothetical protein WC058_11420 [Phycisphaeraceae bacterium]